MELCISVLSFQLHLMLLSKMYTAATALQAHAVYSQRNILGSNFKFCLSTCLRSNGVDMTQHGGHPTATSHQPCVQRPVLHASFWTFHHHISTVQPPLSRLHTQSNASAQQGKDKTTPFAVNITRSPVLYQAAQLSKNGVHQLVFDMQSTTADNCTSDRCQDVFVMLPIALSTDNDAGVAVVFSHTCGETVDTESAKHCGALACKGSEGLSTQL